MSSAPARRARGIVRWLTCCVCGADAGRHEQHWNRDDGYGVCARCVAWERERGTSEEDITSQYGIEGVNFEAPQQQEAAAP